MGFRGHTKTGQKNDARWAGLIGCAILHKFKYSSRKKFLVSLCLVIVLLLNEKLFLPTVFELVYDIAAPAGPNS